MHFQINRWCPCSNFKCYSNRIISILNKYNFTGKLNGVAISLSELIWIKKINEVLQSKLLQEQRDFFKSTYNQSDTQLVNPILYKCLP